MNKRTIQSLDKKIKQRQDAVAKERDKLDELIAEIEQLRETFDQAWEALQSARARDSLSELV